jgi:hypothetical protein
MPIEYRFVIHSGLTVGALGALALADAAEARLFGEGIIHDLMIDASNRHGSYTRDVIEWRVRGSQHPLRFCEVSIALVGGPSWSNFRSERLSRSVCPEAIDHTGAARRFELFLAAAP